MGQTLHITGMWWQVVNTPQQNDAYKALMVADSAYTKEEKLYSNKLDYMLVFRGEKDKKKSY